MMALQGAILMLVAMNLVRELVLGAQRRPLTRSRLRPICMRR
jgi:hypothetical protein